MNYTSTHEGITTADLSGLNFDYHPVFGPVIQPFGRVQLEDDAAERGRPAEDALP